MAAMKARRLINQAKLVFLGLFAVACAGIWTYQIMYVWPSKRCEAAGRWWLAEKRVCGVPVEISTITGRHPPVKVTAPTPAAAAPAQTKAAAPAPAKP